MAGRGRTGTFTQEQMQKLGMGPGSGNKDIPQVSNIPPALYPPLPTKPVNVEINNGFQVLWKNQYLCWMKDSAYHLRKFPEEPPPVIALKESAVTKFVTATTTTTTMTTTTTTTASTTTTTHTNDEIHRINNIKMYMRPTKRREPASFVWSRMPAELKPSATKRKLVMKSNSPKKTKVANLELRLKMLEEKERNSEMSTPLTKDDDSESEKEPEDEDAARDEEMDEENDYGNSYFDNGESYNEEDDNLDDGPVY